MNPKRIEAAKQRVKVSAGDADQAKAWSAEFRRVNVPVKLIDRDETNTTFSVKADSSVNSHTNDALSKIAWTALSAP